MTHETDREDGGLPAWRIKTSSPKTKLVLILLAFRADAPAGTFDFAPTITGIADATGLSTLEVKLALNELLAAGHISGGVRSAGYDDVLDIEVGPGMTRTGNRRVFEPPR